MRLCDWKREQTSGLKKRPKFFKVPVPHHLQYHCKHWVGFVFVDISTHFWQRKPQSVSKRVQRLRLPPIPPSHHPYYHPFHFQLCLCSNNISTRMISQHYQWQQGLSPLNSRHQLTGQHQKVPGLVLLKNYTNHVIPQNANFTTSVVTTGMSFGALHLKMVKTMRHVFFSFCFLLVTIDFHSSPAIVSRLRH